MINKKWIGGGIGWVLGGPIGAIVGFALGSFFDNKISNSKQNKIALNITDFEFCILVLSAVVLKADGKVLKKELDFVKIYLKNNFGNEKLNQFLPILKNILNKNISIRQVCLQINQNLSHSVRLQLLQYLFEIANADNNFDEREFNVLRLISNYLNISSNDFNTIVAMYKKHDIVNYFKILEITETATEQEIKKAYRKMVLKFHPDKVNNLGEQHIKLAKERFQKIQEAYEQIKKHKNIK